MGKARKMILWAMALALIMPLCFGMAGAKAATTYDVTQYGVATGNSGEANRKALQKLLNKAKEGETIELTFPAGTFQIDDTLMIYSNTAMTLNSGTTIQMTTDGTAMVQSGATGAGGYNQTQNVTITGGTWDGNMSGNKQGTLIYLMHGSNIHLKDMTLKNVCGNHFIEFAAVSSSSINNCTMRDFKKLSGVDYSKDTTDDKGNQASVTSEAIQLDYALADSSPSAEPFDGTACSGITISGCSFINCLSGIGNHHTDKTSSSITISNNTFTNVEKTCLNLYAMSGVTVSGNTATSGIKRFAITYGTTGTVSFSRNTITGSGNAYGIDILDCPNGTILVSENTKISEFISGVIVKNSKATVSGNNITDSQDEAVLVQENSTATVNGNIISGCGKMAIYANKSTVTISSNTVEGGSESGIWIKGCKGSSISSNTVKFANSKANIGVEDSECDIKDNKVTGSTNYNIITYGDCSGVISGNDYDIPYGILNDGGMTREKGANKYNGGAEPTAFTILYHETDTAAASSKTTTVQYGTDTYYLKPEELDFSGKGRFMGWKAYRNDFKQWRVIPAGSSDPIWADDVPSGGKFYLYPEIGVLAKTAAPGATLHFYAQWDGDSGLVVPKYVKEIDEYAFENISASSVYVYDRCYKIGAGAFSNCKNLKTIRLPKDCSIGEGCFAGSALTTVTAPKGGTTETWAKENGYTFKAED